MSPETNPLDALTEEKFKNLSGTLERVEQNIEKSFEKLDRKLEGFATRELLEQSVRQLNQRDDEIEKKFDEGSKRTRWTIGIAVPIAGIAVSFIMKFL